MAEDNGEHRRPNFFTYVPFIDRLADAIGQYPKKQRFAAMQKARHIVHVANILAGKEPFDRPHDSLADDHIQDIGEGMKENIDRLTKVLAYAELECPGSLDDSRVVNGAVHCIYKDVLSGSEGANSRLCEYANRSNLNATDYIRQIAEDGDRAADELYNEMSRNHTVTKVGEINVPDIGNATVYKWESDYAGQYYLILAAAGVRIATFAIRVDADMGNVLHEFPTFAFDTDQQKTSGNVFAMRKIIKSLLHDGYIDGVDYHVFTWMHFRNDDGALESSLMNSSMANAVGYSIMNAVNVGYITESMAERLVFILLTAVDDDDISVKRADALLHKVILSYYGPDVNSCDWFSGGILEYESMLFSASEWLDVILISLGGIPYNASQLSAIFGMHHNSTLIFGCLDKAARNGTVEMISPDAVLNLRAAVKENFSNGALLNFDSTIVNYWSDGMIRLNDEFFYQMLDYRHISTATINRIYNLAMAAGDSGSKRARYIVSRFCNRRFCEMVLRLGDSMNDKVRNSARIKELMRYAYGDDDSMVPEYVNTASNGIGFQSVSEIISSIYNVVHGRRGGVSTLVYGYDFAEFDDPTSSRFAALKRELSEKNMMFDVVDQVLFGNECTYISMVDVRHVCMDIFGIDIDNPSMYISIISSHLSSNRDTDRNYININFYPAFYQLSQAFGHEMIGSILHDKYICHCAVNSCADLSWAFNAVGRNIECLDVLVGMIKNFDSNYMRGFVQLKKLFEGLFSQFDDPACREIIESWFDDDYMCGIVDLIKYTGPAEGIVSTDIKRGINLLTCVEARLMLSDRVISYTLIEVPPSIPYMLEDFNSSTYDRAITRVLGILNSADFQRQIATHANSYVLITQIVLFDRAAVRSNSAPIVLDRDVIGHALTMYTIAFIRSSCDPDEYGQVVDAIGLGGLIGNKSESSVVENSANLIESRKIGGLMWSVDYYNMPSGSPSPSNMNIRSYKAGQLESVMPNGWRLPTHSEVVLIAPIIGQDIRFARTGCYNSDGMAVNQSDACFWSIDENNEPCVEVVHGDEYREYDIEDSSGYMAPVRLVCAAN